MPRRNSGPKLRFLDKRGVYYIVWTEGGRSRERSTGTADGGQAEVALAEFLNIRLRSSGPRDPSETLVTDALADYAEEVAPSTATPWRIGLAIKALTPFWEGRTIVEVTKETCKRYVAARSRSNGTARRELGVLRAAINHAHREGRLTRTVAVHLPDGGEPRDRWLTRSEVAALLRAALREPRVRLYLPLFILLATFTGRRKEAILSLRWAQVDLGAGVIDFRTLGAPVSNKRRGRVRIPEKLLPHLRRARALGTDLGFVINDNGKRLGDIKRSFASACGRAGLEGISPHSLRHTCATWLMQAGIPKWEASGFLAMTEETLERVYGHHHPDFQRASAAALSRPRNVRGIGSKLGGFRG